MLTDKAELEYLEKVKSYIEAQLDGYDENMLSLKTYIREERSRMWEDFVRNSSEPDMFELVQITQTETRDSQRYERLISQNESLKILAKTPYFARLDFKEDGLDKETIYIGRRLLSDENSSDILVCDWRSDISGMYYDSPLGKTFYTSVQGKIPCELLLRRQYKIVDGKLIYMFDSDVAIEDDILQEELSKTSDTKLKTIISTIQAEQNTIIRNLDANLLLVQGVAGSGKTSIALHRLAYILYKYRKVLTSANIIIFSPNNVFNAYIADVLPDLGEDKVLQTSFYELLSPFIQNNRSLGEQTERVFNGETSTDEILYKGSQEFCEKLENYFKSTVENDVTTKDLYLYDSSVRTKKELDYLYFNLYKSFSPEIRKRKIKESLLDYADLELRPAQEKRYEKKLTEGGSIAYNDDEFALAKESCWQEDILKLSIEIDKMFTLDISKAYIEALKDTPYYKKTKTNIKNGIVNFEDMLCIAYLKFLAGSIPIQRRIKHIVIDEAQDYPYILYKLIAKIFTEAKYTILGDIQQAFIPQQKSISDIGKCFNAQKTLYVKLNKSYRSTVEINEYLKGFMHTDADTSYYKRHGEEVTFAKSEDLKEIILELEQKYSSRAIICKTTAKAKEISEKFDIKLIGNDDVVMPGKTLVMPAYLAKGLEFDAVIVFEETATDFERHAYYVSASRALHKLIIIK